MKPSTVIIIVVTILLLAGITIWVVFAQARNTLSQAEKTAKVAADATGNVDSIIKSGKAIWGDAQKWFEDRNS